MTTTTHDDQPNVPRATTCCPPAAQQGCCGSADKLACCGPNEVAPSSCGCQH